MALQYSVFPVTPFQQNCTIVVCSETGSGAVIDPGGDIDRLMEVITSNNLRIEKILLTHGHIDHAGGTADLKERLDVPVIGPHSADAFWIDNLDMQSKRFGFEHARNFTPDQWLNDNDQVELGNLKFDVVHCPGHTPGHVVFHQVESKWAQVGDVIFKGSIGRTDFPMSNHDDLLHSIRNKLFPLGDDVQFVPGHGPMSTFGEERASNPFVSDSRYG